MSLFVFILAWISVGFIIGCIISKLDEYFLSGDFAWCLVIWPIEILFRIMDLLDFLCSKVQKFIRKDKWS